MKTKTIVLMVAILLAVPQFAVAKDVALILNDQQQAKLVHALDVAIRTNGLAIAPDMVELFNLLKTAPVVESTKVEPVKPVKPSKDSSP